MALRYGDFSSQNAAAQLTLRAFSVESSLTDAPIAP
jgi:hypothetical protein